MSKRRFAWLLTAFLISFLALQGSIVRADEDTTAKIWRGPWPVEDMVTDYVLVKFREPEGARAFLRGLGVSPEALQAQAALPEGWARVDTQLAARAFGLTIQAAQPNVDDVMTLARRLAERPDVEMVAFDYAVVRVPDPQQVVPANREGISPAAVPTDPWYPLQWHYPFIGAEQVWDVEVGDPGIVVAVIDTGVTEGPLDGFANPFWMECDTSGDGWVCGPGAAFPVDPHGNHVAGTVAQESSLVTPGDDGLVGMAPGISLFPIQTFDPVFVVATFTDLAEAITLAAENGADVINMSLGADCGSLTWADGCRSPIVDAAIEDAVLNWDVVIVAAAGNAAQSVVGYPANHPLVIAVAAGDQNSLAYYSTFGVGLSVTAPGGNFFEDIDGDGYPDLIWQETYDGDPTVAANWNFYGYQGTSMATPHVAGLVALMRSANPAANWLQVRACLESTAADVYPDDPAPGYDYRYGHGLIQARAAVDCILNPPDIAALDVNAYSITADSGISETLPANLTAITQFYLSETNGGGTLDWTAYTSYSPDCSSTDVVPWLILTTTSGSLPPFTSASYDVILDATQTGGVGTFVAYICIASNDPDPGPGNNTNLIPIPVLLQVDEPLVAPDELVCNGLPVTFEEGIPTTWTVIDNEGTGVVWDVTGAGTCVGLDNYTNGTGQAACVSSDAAGVVEFDTELWTNPITIPSTATSATLTFTANYQNYLNRDFFEVDVSTDGGATWTNLLSWNDDFGGFFSKPGVDVTLDLSSYIGQTIILRFRYYDPNTGDWDWYVQIDDVALQCEGVPSAAPNIDVSPLALNFQLNPNETQTQALTIANTGDQDLGWGFAEEDQGATLLNEPPKVVLEGNRFRIADEDLLRQLRVEPQGDWDFLVIPGLLSTAVTIDGLIAPGEWDDAAVLNIATSLEPVYLYTKYDPSAQILYLAIDNTSDLVLNPSDAVFIDFEDEGGTPPVLFDNDWFTSCPTTEGTFYITADGTVEFDGIYFDQTADAPAYCGSPTSVPAISVAASDVAGNVQFEIAIPLDGSTPLVAAPDTFVGIGIALIDNDVPSLDGWWPLGYNLFEPATYSNFYFSTQCSALTDVPWLSVNPTSGITVPGASSPVDVTVDATGLAPGFYQANLCIFSNDPDVPTGDNGTGLVVVPVSLDVAGVDLELTKTVDKAAPLYGEIVTFTLTLREARGAFDATGVQVTDLLPSGLSHIGHTASQGTYDPNTGIWDVGTLPAGGTATLEIQAQVLASGVYTNVAEVTAQDQVDLDSTPGDGMGDDYAEVTLDPVPAIDLELELAHSPASPLPGDAVNFTFTVRNISPADTARGVVVRVFLEDGFNYVSDTPSQGTTTVTVGSTDILWNVGDLAPGASATLTVRALMLDQPKKWLVWGEVIDASPVDRDSVPGDGRGDDYVEADLRPTLPATGFAPGRLTVLPPKPADLTYAPMDMTFEIPRLGVETTIVSMPSSPDAVLWLGDRVGHLSNSTFPTWQGNAVLAAHNYLPNGLPGPFERLSELRWGDVIRITYMGMVYEYQVRVVDIVDQYELWPLRNIDDGYSWITLIGCVGTFDENGQRFPERVVVQAVLMQVYPASP